ncbi:MAG: hypothetical protein M1820_009614 [Bogoriella megaspora]|nr:MAG: hypothetical protein M1820_009614 [Bogoriella megaspora]
MPESASVGDGNLSVVASGVSGGHSGFSTSGVISWNSLVDTTFSTTIGVLSRISAAGVDPYTVVVGQALGSQFQLTRLGRRRITDALEMLPSFRATGNALSFGFGVNHLVRVMARSEQGISCLLLCGSLAECYPIEYAAEILIEMVKTTQAPADLRPSILQWKALLEACAGIFSLTRFSSLLDGFMRLHPSYPVLFSPFVSSPIGLNPSERCSSPADLASAILALAQISRDDLASITIVGGADAGFLAAVAERYFQFALEIKDEATGDTLYLKRLESDFVQVTILFTKSHAKDTPQIQLTERTVRLRDAASVMYTDEDRKTYLSGRTEWKDVLTTLFGSTFRRAAGYQETFGASIGYLACIVAYISSTAEGPWPATTERRVHREAVAYLAAESTGHNLINVILTYMPELIPFQEAMEKSSQENFSRARQTLQRQIASLRMACQCRQCHACSSLPESEQKSFDKHCLVFLLFTIVRIGQIMSLVENPLNILPSKEGLSRLYGGIYKDALGHHLDQHSDENRVIESFLFQGTKTKSTVCHILPEVLAIYSKRGPDLSGLGLTSDRWDNVCAHSNSDGICVYWKALAESSGGHLTTRLMVIPGRIELEGKLYSHMIDRPHLGSPGIPFEGWEKLGSAGIDGIFGVSVPTPCGGLSVLIRETTTELQIAFETPTLSRNAKQDVLITPAVALEAYMLTKSIVSCPRLGCTKHLQDAEVQETKEGLTRYVYRGKLVTIFDASVAQQWYLGNHASHELIFCVDGQCIDCCLTRSADYVQLLDSEGFGKCERYAIVRAAPE